MNLINIKIAFRNILRNKPRSSVVIAAVTVGIFGGLAASSVMKGMVSDMIDNSLKNTTSHIQIHEKNYQDNNEIFFFIKDANKLSEKIKKIKDVKAVCIRTKITAMASTGSKTTGIIVNGIQPENEKKVTEIYSKLIGEKSKYFESNKRNRILISSKLAEKLKLKIKSKIILTFQDFDGNLTGASFKVEGIFKTQNAAFDEQNVFVRKKDLDRLLNMPENSAHEIALILNDYEKTGDVINKIKTITEYYPEAWYDTDPYLKLTSSLTTFMLFLFLGIILFALSFAIVNTMLMAILERKKEIGMIKAIGMNKKRIFSVIMYETVFLTLFGGVFGIILSVFFISYFGHSGIDISSVGEGFEALGYASVIYPELGLTDYAEVVILVLLTGIISSIFPTVRAIKMNPADAVRTD